MCLGAARAGSFPRGWDRQELSMITQPRGLGPPRCPIREVKWGWGQQVRLGRTIQAYLGPDKSLAFAGNHRQQVWVCSFKMQL